MWYFCITRHVIPWLCSGTSFSTVLKSCQENGRVVMKGNVQRYWLATSGGRFFVTFYFLVTDILCLVIQYFGSIN